MERIHRANLITTLASFCSDEDVQHQRVRVNGEDDHHMEEQGNGEADDEHSEHIDHHDHGDFDADNEHEEVKSNPELQHLEPEIDGGMEDDRQSVGHRARKDFKIDDYVSANHEMTAQHDFDDLIEDKRELKQVPKRKKRSRLDNVFMFANKKDAELSQEIRKIEQSFGGKQDLLKKLTQLSFDGENIDIVKSYEQAPNCLIDSELGANQQKIAPLNRLSFKEQSSSDEEDSEEAQEEMADVVEQLQLFDGPGLDQEIPRLPSTSNMNTILIRSRTFKNSQKPKGPPNSLVQSAIQPAKEAVVLESKTHHDIRLRYLSKLTYHQVWLAPSKQKKSHQNVIILDWDDTMLPTSFLISQDSGGATDLQHMACNNMRMLVHVQNELLKLLDKMIKFAKVLIVTNAKEGWVEYSSYYLLPRVHQLIETYVPVVSAQTEFQEKFPFDPSQWKEQAFRQMWDVEGLIERNCVLNMIVIGDSDFELDAGKKFKKAAATMTDKRVLLKLVKFKEDPSPEQLIQQLKTLNEKFDMISSNQKSLFMELDEQPVVQPQVPKRRKRSFFRRR